MKKLLIVIILFSILLTGCMESQNTVHIAATTRPVYDLTVRICDGTGLQVERLISDNVSCLHDYSLQVDQMRTLASAELIVISGMGLESFMEDILPESSNIINASEGVSLICGSHSHEETHSHEEDPHIWLSPKNAKIMANNIYNGLTAQYPHLHDLLTANLQTLLQDLDDLQEYADSNLSDLSCRQIITFHDGFSYMADAFDLTILESLEEESGSEASASELIHLIELVKTHHLPCIFTETNGSTSAAQIIAAETGIGNFCLDMAMGSRDYFEAMYYNIDTIKEALG